MVAYQNRNTARACQKLCSAVAFLVSLYELKPPISKKKIVDITKAAMKAIKFYKHIVFCVEKFLTKVCVSVIFGLCCYNLERCVPRNRVFWLINFFCRIFTSVGHIIYNASCEMYHTE
uniref:TFIIB domain-containing protein n=1 Tax=Ascaris lumbricoides TaxID=6252 RepID=A0A0M3HLN9_ASCLU